MITQADAVYQAMLNDGGYATLGRLYQTALKIPGSTWGTKTPFATIRRIVQEDSRFEKLKPGLWAVTDQKQAVLQRLNIGQTATKEKEEEFNHSYYQGLLVEIGNLKNYKTFIPHPDKNKQYLTQRLRDVASLEQFYSFTYDRLLRRGQTVDVTWFNDRGFPHAFYEVEHSTDIRNSLGKFLAFQDFRIKFYIVADRARKREYEDKLNDTTYKPIKAHVAFLDYDQLSEWHSKSTELAGVETQIVL